MTDLSVLILDDISSPKGENLLSLTEQELSILNEGFVDFLKSIKDMEINKLKKMISTKFEVIDKAQKAAESKLSKHGVDTNKLASIVNSTVASYKSKLASIAKRSDRRAIQSAVADIGNGVKEQLEKKKRSWFNAKYWDPTLYLSSFVVALVVITVKALLLALMVVFFPLSIHASIGTVVFNLLCIFILIPIIEESGKLFAVKTGQGSQFNIVFNITDFFVMFATKIALTGPVNMITFILMRLAAAAVHTGTLEVQSRMQDDAKNTQALTISVCINAVRTFIEMMLMYVPKM